MKACVFLALFLVLALATVAHCSETHENPSVHNLMKRQIRSGCALWECSSNCRRRGYSGGYCAFTGCRCY
ncbi:unnamed protein product, partial [Brenthis ino]